MNPEVPVPAGETAPVKRRGLVVGRRVAITLALVLTLGGLGLRLSGLEDRVFSHPENFVPGVDVPDWLRYPPDRLTLPQILRSTMIDGHPPTYFVALLPWVNTFGTSLWSLRLPSALAGAACIWLLWLVARRLTDEPTALLAAGLLAIHGFAIYWSQMARMYTMVALLGLLSTFFLLRALESGRRRDQTGYFLATTLALWTQLYAWPLVAAQLVWCGLRAAAGPRSRIILRLGLLAIAVSAPIVQLSMAQNPASDWQLSARGYYEFGYLFSSFPFWNAAPWQPTGIWLLAGCVTLLAIGLVTKRWTGPGAVEGRDGDDPWSRTWDWILAAATSAVKLLLAWRVFGLEVTFLAISLLPVALVALTPRIIATLVSLAQRFPRSVAAARSIPLPALLAILPMVKMTVVSMLRGVLVARGTMVFLPFLLLLVAQGLTVLLYGGRPWRRWLGAAVTGSVAVLFALSILRVRQANGAARDYASLAGELRRVVRPGDLVLVRNDYVIPPLFYYFDRSYDTHLVHRDHEQAIQQADTTASIWLVHTCLPNRDALQFPGLEQLEFHDRQTFTGIELWRFRRPGTGGGAQPDECIVGPRR